MNNYHITVYEMWDKFVQSNPEIKSNDFKSWYFCDTEKCANDLADLVLRGIKRATASLNYWYKSGKEIIPKAGELNVITNWDGIAQCITITRSVTILKFKDVSSEMASTEGEGDKSLDYWRKAHIHFFTNELIKEKLEFDEEMEIVFEEFEMIYK